MFSFFSSNKAITETLQDHIKRKLAAYSDAEFAYTVLNKKNPAEMIIISSYPDDWVNFYRASNFQLTDPVILNAYRRTSPFAWDENLTFISNIKFTRIFSLSKKYDIVNGFTFVLHDQMNNLALLSVIITSLEQKLLETRLSTEKGELQMALIDINEQMYRLAGFAMTEKAQQRAESKKGIFSTRENEVLYWVSVGKTYGEIAIITGISLSTVKFHIRNVFNKLGVNNIRQAMALAVELGLIVPAVNLAKS